MPNEIELKLRIARADAAQLGWHPALREHLVGKPVTRRLVSIYYDTPDLRLLESEISLRVRRMSGKWFQAVKGAGHALAGLHQRMEWEDAIAKGEPDFSKITEPELAALFADSSLRSTLRPIFTTDVRRTEWQLAFEDGSVIEVALDLGQLLPGATAESQQSESIEEVEIELKQGHASHVFALALALQADIPLHIENISKAQRGYAYYVPSRLVDNKVQIFAALPSGTPSAEAFQALAGACLQRMQASQDALLGAQQRSAEPMRTAVQQLTFALKAFGRKDTGKELAWVRKALDTVQDWDRFLHDTLPAFASASSDLSGLLHQRAVSSRKRARTRLLQILKSQRYQRLLLNMGACLAAAAPPAEKKARPQIKSYLRRCRKKLQRQSLGLQQTDLKALRKLRDRTDHLRYGEQLLAAGHHTGASHDAFIQALNDWDEALAALENTALTTMLIERQRHRADTAITAALDMMTPWNKARAVALHARIEPTHRALLVVTAGRN
jgi:triphosphatase